MIEQPINKFQIKNSGIAILLVISTIAILSYLLADFTYKTQINKLKSINLEDKLQARLNAEAGMNFALSQLRIYQEALNFLEANENAKKLIKPSNLQSILAIPMIFPFQVPTNSLIAKNAANDFNNKVLLEGEMSVSISPVRGFINVNSLALDLLQDDTGDQVDQTGQTNQTEVKKRNTLIRGKLLRYFEDKLKAEVESSTQADFQAKYGTPDARKLVTELQFYVTSKRQLRLYQGDLDFSEAESYYNDAGVNPKNAPMTSLSELYLLQGWNDALVELLKDKLTVHQSNVIEVNKLTKEQLILLFPDISKIQIEEFFKYRDGDQELNIKAKPFKTKTDFINLTVEKLQVLSKEDFEKLEKDLKNMGLTFGVASNYYEIKSLGRYENATYQITALVEIPLLEEIQKKPKDKDRPPAKKLYLKPRIIEFR